MFGADETELTVLGNMFDLKTQTAYRRMKRLIIKKRNNFAGLRGYDGDLFFFSLTRSLSPPK